MSIASGPPRPRLSGLLLCALLIAGGCDPGGADLKSLSLSTPAPASVTTAPADAVGAPPDALVQTASTSAEQTSCRPRPLPEYATRMVGAEPTSIEDWPGFAAIGAVSLDGTDSVFFCGGVLVDPTTVITAAHCLDSTRRRADGTLVLKNSDYAGYRLAVLTNQDDIRADGPQTRALVARGEVYRDGEQAYDPTTVTHDIAYLTLEKALPGPFARLAGTDEANPGLEGHLLWAAGFGQLGDEPSAAPIPVRSGGTTLAQSVRLLDAVLPRVAPEACRSAYNGNIDDRRQICTGWRRGGRDTCYGDSGGPLVAIGADNCPYVVGLTSFGSREGCGAANAFGVYTRVSHYRSWIESRASGARFVETPPPAMGAAATSRFLELMIDTFAQPAGSVRVEMVNRATLKPFPVEGGRMIVRAGEEVVYKVVAGDPASGQLLLIDRREGRTGAEGQLSREYVVLYPNPALSAGAKAQAASSLTIGEGAVRLKGGLEDPEATRERGELIALVLPASVDLSGLIAPPVAERGFSLEAGGEPIRAIEEIESVRALISSAAGAGPSFASALLPYEIRR
jgi:secreted trypsin-like serine protease